MKDHIVPFFVADRPASFLILKGILLTYPQTRVGIMTHVFTSTKVWQIFNEFPRRLPLVYEDQVLLSNENSLSESLVKMVDSGIFSRSGCTIAYEELFDRYNKMGTNFGVIIDVFGNAKATLKSADEASRIYHKNKKKYCFKLVAAAQGTTLEEYLECYQRLSCNFRFVAVGGLLKKREKSARYVSVRDERFLYEVLQAIREEFNPEWLFVLGCYHPSRHRRFEEIGVWGSDYKGWIFNYKRKRELVRDRSHDLLALESEYGLTRILRQQLDRTKEIEEHLLTMEKRWRETKDPLRKKALWIQTNELKRELEVAYNELIVRRELLKGRNGLPADYKTRVAVLRKTADEKEQTLRFRQVRKYIETNVYTQLR